MSEATETDETSMLAMLFQDVAAPEPEPVVEAPAAQEAAPVVEAEPTEPEPAPEAPAAVEEAPVWPNQQEAGRAFAEKTRQIRELETALAAERAEKAYQAGLAAGRAPQPTPVVKDEDPEPDPNTFADDGAYYLALRAWDRRQVVREVRAELLPEVQNLKESAAKRAASDADRAWGESMSRAETAAGADWPAVVAYAKAMQANSPGWAGDLDTHADPGQFALDAYRAARGGLTAAAAPTPAPAPRAAAAAPLDINALINDPAHRETVLKAMATERARAGVSPSIPSGPRGVGSGPGAAGVEDQALTSESIRAMRDPQKLEKLSGDMFAGFLGIDT